MLQFLETIDFAALFFFQQLRQPGLDKGMLGLDKVMLGLTYLGDRGVLIGVVVAAALVLFLRNERRTALLLVVALGLAFGTSEGVKRLVDRPRPNVANPVVPPLYKLTDKALASLQTAGMPEAVLAKLTPLKGKTLEGKAFLDELTKVLDKKEQDRYQDVILDQTSIDDSFPSSHALLSMTVYGCVAVVLLRRQKKVRLRLLIGAAAVILILVVGFSRLYLCVHFATDVLGGWCAGFAFVMLFLWADRRVAPLRGIEARLNPPRPTQPRPRPITAPPRDPGKVWGP
jgi:membrane-associated phospholipid phosphatase